MENTFQKEKQKGISGLTETTIHGVKVLVKDMTEALREWSEKRWEIKIEKPSSPKDD